MRQENEHNSQIGHSPKFSIIDKPILGADGNMTTLGRVREGHFRAKMGIETAVIERALETGLIKADNLGQYIEENGGGLNFLWRFNTHDLNDYRKGILGAEIFTRRLQVANRIAKLELINKKSRRLP